MYSRNMSNDTIRNVIIVADSAEMDGGATKVAIDTACALGALGFKIVYFAGAGVPDEKLDEIETVVVFDYSCIDNPSKLEGALQGIWSLRTQKCLASLLDAFEPHDTVIHVHSWTHTLSSSVFSAIKKRGFKAVVTLHDYFLLCPNGGFYDYVRNEICARTPLSISCLRCNCDKRNYFQKLYRCIRMMAQRRSMRRVSAIFAYLSPFSLEIFLRHTKTNFPVRYLPNPVETREGYTFRSFDEDSKKRQGYIYVGRLGPEKNPRMFCEAITSAGVNGTVAGDGPMLEALKEEFPNILFLGWSNQEDIANLYRTHRALVLTSSCYETSSLSCLEALLIGGLPVIIPDTCAATSFVQNRVNGLLFNNKNTDSLVEAIINMEDEGLRSALVGRISSDHCRMEKEYGTAEHVNRLISLYQEALCL